MNSGSLSFVALAVLALMPCNGAHAETTNCTVISSLPFNISTSGVYCLNADLSSTSSGITMSNNNFVGIGDVVIDLNGHVITGPAVRGADSSTSGIQLGGALKVKHIEVRNGAIRGFGRGIYATFAVGAHVLVEDMDIADCIRSGVTQEANTLVTVRRTTIARIGGWSAIPYGIVASQGDVTFQNNKISAVFSEPQYAVGGSSIRIDNVAACTVSHNVVNSGGTPSLIGIEEIASSCSIVDNWVSNAATGFSMSLAKYRDNVANSSVQYVGGVNIGNNN